MARRAGEKGVRRGVKKEGWREGRCGKEKELVVRITQPAREMIIRCSSPSSASNTYYYQAHYSRLPDVQMMAENGMLPTHGMLQ